MRRDGGLKGGQPLRFPATLVGLCGALRHASGGRDTRQKYFMCRMSSGACTVVTIATLSCLCISYRSAICSYVTRGCLFRSRCANPPSHRQRRIRLYPFSGYKRALDAWGTHLAQW